uniref:Uncharacterized protein n=1 Tax=Mola mola TaxID=94237 RepID=A0A3Q3WEK9_MOLML
GERLNIPRKFIPPCHSSHYLKPHRRGIYDMYHGTSVASARLIISNGFKQSSSGMLGQGVYVSRDKKKADSYPLGSKSTDRVILALHVRPGRVKRIDKADHPLRTTWHANGYDTAWVPPNCGMTLVRSGREEDCVFDPKRVEVVGIAQAPDNAIRSELQQLLSKTAKRPRRRGNGAADACSLCKRKTQQGAPHIKQTCWECGRNICILMSKHVCPAKPGRE